MKLKFIISTLLIIILAILTFRFTQKKTTTEETPELRPVKVLTQSVERSQIFKKILTYPAILASENQINITANSSGIITQLNFDLGKNVYKNQRLATIDSAGTISSPGANGLRSSQIQALELAVESARENYKLARDNYRKDDSYANKKTKEIAELGLLSAEASLRGALDGQFINSPISGTITQKNVSLGDSVSFGQTIATVSQLGNLKVQFFVDKEELAYFKIGEIVNLKENGNSIQAKVSKISPQADEATKRFMLEATPTNQKNLMIGSVITVEFSIDYSPAQAENIILPLSAITAGQNENYIFIIQEQKAHKIEVKIEKVFGEMAEIKADLKNEDLIIVEGNKLLKEGAPVIENQI